VLFLSQPHFTFSYGREDCPTSPAYPPDVAVGLPGGGMGVQGVIDFFSDTFNVDVLGAVALLGAHTIGAMGRRQSGYTGQWKVDQDDKVVIRKLS